jgi:hypothetical protein
MEKIPFRGSPKLFRPSRQASLNPAERPTSVAEGAKNVTEGDLCPAKSTPSSNPEMLRIQCMLLIMGDHLTGQNGNAEYATLQSSFAFGLIGCGSRTA